MFVVSFIGRRVEQFICRDTAGLKLLQQDAKGTEIKTKTCRGKKFVPLVTRVAK